MVYDRWTPTLNHSLAYLLFRRHHTEINSYYWAHHAAMRGAFSLTATKQKTDLAQAVFPNPGGERKRNISLGKWADDYNGFDNWSRLSATVAISGYFEMFLRMIVDAACQSCPAILIGGSKEIEGAKLLKSRTNYDFADKADLCAKGTWQQRSAMYKSIFASCPQFIEDHISELDQFRIMRNAVGHAFGRDADAPVVGVLPESEKPKSVKQDKLQSYLALAYNAATAIDSHLAGTYIGCYETLAMYHRWPARTTGTWGMERESFRTYFQSVTKRQIHKEYTAALFDAYGKL